jgi:hypothetical protein
MIGTQMIGFITNLYFAYGFGQIYGPILDQRSISENSKMSIPLKTDGHVVFSSPMYHVP